MCNSKKCLLNTYTTKSEPGTISRSSYCFHELLWRSTWEIAGEIMKKKSQTEIIYYRTLAKIKMEIKGVWPHIFHFHCSLFPHASLSFHQKKVFLCLNKTLLTFYLGLGYWWQMCSYCSFKNLFISFSFSMKCFSQ